MLSKPVRPRMLCALLERLWPVAPTGRASVLSSPVPSVEIGRPGSNVAPSTTAQTLSVLRDFSGILTHSLDSEGMLKQFLLLLRELLSINRAAIFLRQPFTSPAGSGSSSGERRLRAASADRYLHRIARAL